MTDQTIPADKIREVIKKMKDNRAGVDDSNHGRGYHRALTNYIPDLEALLPAPRSLADELRALADSCDKQAKVTLSVPLKNALLQLDGEIGLFADRVETLEKEHDEAQAEIARLRDRDNDDSPTQGPGCPTHLKTLEEYQNAPAGTIVQMEVPGWAHFIKDDEGCWATKGFIGYYTSESMSGTPCVVVEWGSEPVETLEPERIDPASCGKYRPYLVEIAGEERVAVRKDNDSVPWVTMSGFDYYSDEDVRVIRPLTESEMDAR